MFLFISLSLISQILTKNDNEINKSNLVGMDVQWPRASAYSSTKATADKEELDKTNADAEANRRAEKAKLGAAVKNEARAEQAARDAAKAIENSTKPERSPSYTGSYGG